MKRSLVRLLSWAVLLAQGAELIKT